MKLKLLLLPILFLVTLQTWGQKKYQSKKPHSLSNSTVYAYAFPTTVEYGENSTLEFEAVDSSGYQIPVYSISWAPASSVLYPTAAEAYATPKTTTTYTVTLNTSSGILTDTVTIHIGCSINSWLNTWSYYCPADEGRIDARVYGGIEPYTYSWSDGESTSTIAGLSIGSYSLTVTDSLGCKTIDTTTVTTGINYMPAVQTIELGDSAELSAWVGDPQYSYTYSWAPASSVTNPNYYYTWAHPKTTTTYTLTATGICGTFTDTATISVGCGPSIAYVSATPYFCSAGASATGSMYNGVAPFTYKWSNGQTTSTITGLSVGSYSLTMTDANGCSASTSYATIIGNAKLSVSAYSYGLPIEPGDSVPLFASPADSMTGSYGSYYDPSFTFSWAPAASVTNPNSMNTSAHPNITTTYTVTMNTYCGNYTDTVTVSIGCAASAYIYTTPYYCAGDSGSATAYVSNGSPPYTYAWSTGQTTSSLMSIPQGSYSVTVTDSYGCSSTDIEYVYPGTHYIVSSAYPTTIAPGDSAFIQTWRDTLSDFKYSWTPAASVTNPDSASTYVHPTVTTTYTLTAITPCGILTDTVTIHVTCNYYNQQICIVTTDTSINKNVIIWGRNNSPPNGSFNIYSATTSGWVKIGNVLDTALSEYIDTTSDPTTRSYSYELSTVDSCGESALSFPSNTIYLQVIIGTGKDSLYWTRYVGFSTPVYKIYRGPALNALTLIDSVSGSTLSYVDVSPPAGSMYLVEAENPSGSCTPTHRHVSPHENSISANASFSNGGIPHKPTGIVNISSGISITVSPNPSNGLFAINYSLSRIEDVDITVIDEFGRSVYDKQFMNQQTGASKQQINLEGLAEGVYSLRIIAGDGIVVKKIVILNNR